MPGNSDNTLFQLTILDRERILYQGEVQSLTSINDTGEFDVLAAHENFISLIYKKVVYRPPKQEEQVMPISRGILHVYANRAKVFI